VKTFRVSTGKEKTPTKEGNFYIYDRYRHRTMRSRGVPKGHPNYYLVEDVPYTQFFNGDMAFHGAFWHNSFGRPVSHGCVNMSTREMNKRWPNAVEDAGWLYNWASLGVPVTVLKDESKAMMLSKSQNY
jgi:lipoprotein-anchoring transpeptidase ErfK/SrfK